MDSSFFVTVAYASTAVLLVALVGATWRRARAVARALASRGDRP